MDRVAAPCEGGEVNARDLIDRASITDAWTALGGPPLRHGRGVAFWRGGDGYNVKLSTERGLWYDHARGDSGGILDLIQTVLGCDRRGAVHWLANHLGVELDSEPLSPSARRQWARRRARAEREARSLADWRADYLASLRARRNAHWDSERDACATALQLLDAGDDDSPTWGAVWAHAPDDIEGERIEREIDRVAGLGTAELIALRDRLTPRELAA